MARCKPCFGGGKLYGAFGDSWDCIPCNGTGERRTGPYRLTDGDDCWSDGVVRHWRIKSLTWQATNPRRAFVFREAEDSWVSANGYHSKWERFPTHAEAIAYADRAARTTKNGDNK